MEKLETKSVWKLKVSYLVVTVVIVLKHSEERHLHTGKECELPRQTEHLDKHATRLNQTPQEHINIHGYGASHFISV